MITAKMVRPDAGYTYDQNIVKELELESNKHYTLKEILIGQSMSTVILNEFPNTVFNSVHFDFYEDGREFDIYRDKRFSTYVNI